MKQLSAYIRNTDSDHGVKHDYMAHHCLYAPQCCPGIVAPGIWQMTWTMCPRTWALQELPGEDVHLVPYTCTN